MLCFLKTHREVIFIRTAESIALWNNRFTDRKFSVLKVDEWCSKNDVSRHAITIRVGKSRAGKLYICRSVRNFDT